MGNFSALFFLCLSFAVPLLSPTLRRDRSLLLVVYASLVMRTSIALVNAFVTPILDSWGDLYRFHNIGAGLDPELGQPYGEFLRVLYRVCGVSFWLGEQASVLAYSFSLLAFVEIALILGGRRKLILSLLLFGLLPSPAIHGSVTLRESYQVLGFLCACLALLRLRQKPNLGSGVMLGLALVGLVTMHQALAPFAVGIIALGVPWALQGRGGYGAILALLALTILPMAVPKVIDSLESHSLAARVISDGQLLEFASGYRNYVSAARSDYGVKIEADSISNFLSTTFLVVLMYFLAPLPWQVSSILDYYALFEVILRLLLLYGCLRQIASSRGETRQAMVFLLAVAMALEVMWAMGTTNWGTSLRHHTVALGVFVLIGAPYFPLLSLDGDYDSLLRRRSSRPPETAPSGIDVISLITFYRKHRRTFWATTLVVGVVVAVVSRPAAQLESEVGGPAYVSSASLLLSSGTCYQLNSILANTMTRADLTFWLSDSRMFRQLLKRQRVYERMEERCRKKNPDLIPYCRTVAIEARYSDIKEVDLYHDSGANVDYARIQEEQGEDRTESRRAGRVTIESYGDTPQNAQFLAQAAVSEVQRALEDMATRRIKVQRKAIEGYLRAAERKSIRAQKGLDRASKAEPARLAELTETRSQLSKECLRLERECRNLERQIRQQGRDSEIRRATQDDDEPLKLLFDKISREKVAAEQIYLPDSLSYQVAADRQRRVSQFFQEQEAKVSMREVQALQAELQSRQTLLHEYQSEIRRMLQSVPAPRTEHEFREKERELAAWEQERLRWEKQLLRTRIEELLSLGDGTALLLKSPLPGQPSLAPVKNWFVHYKHTFAMLPLAPLVGLLTLLLVHLIQDARDIRSRVGKYLDTPVLGLVAPLPRAKDQSPSVGRNND